LGKPEWDGTSHLATFCAFPWRFLEAHNLTAPTPLSDWTTIPRGGLNFDPPCFLLSTSAAYQPKKTYTTNTHDTHTFISFVIFVCNKNDKAWSANNQDDHGWVGRKQTIGGGFNKGLHGLLVILAGLEKEGSTHSFVL
jgi:hypothetical protein